MPPMESPSAELAHFAAALRFEQIPAPVVARAQDLMLDWFASALAGRSARPVMAVERFAAAMGAETGRAEVLVTRRMTSVGSPGTELEFAL